MQCEVIVPIVVSFCAIVVIPGLWLVAGDYYSSASVKERKEEAAKKRKEAQLEAIAEAFGIPFHPPFAFVAGAMVLSGGFRSHDAAYLARELVKLGQPPAPIVVPKSKKEKAK